MATTREKLIEAKFQNKSGLKTTKLLEKEITALFARKKNINGVIVVTEINTGIVLQSTINDKNAYYQNSPPKRKEYYYKMTVKEKNMSVLEKLDTVILKKNLINYFNNEFVGKKRFSINEELVSTNQKEIIRKSIINFINKITTTDVKIFLGEVSTEITKQLVALSVSPNDISAYKGFINNILGKMFEVIVYEYLKTRLNKNSKELSENLSYEGDKNTGQGDFMLYCGNKKDIESISGLVDELKSVIEKGTKDKENTTELIKKIFSHLSPLLNTNNKIDSITRFIKYVIFVEDESKAKTLLIDVSKKIGDERTRALITDVRLLKNEIDKNKINFETIKNSFIERNRISRSFLYENVNLKPSLKRTSSLL